MRATAVLLAACGFALSLLPGTAHAVLDEKAVARAMEQQRKAAESEMRRQAEYEKKAVEQQQRAMQEQMKAQQKFVEQQQKVLHEQQKALQNPQKTTQNQPAGQKQPTIINSPHITTTQTATPIYHATRPYYGHFTSHAYHRTSYRTYRTMPTQVDPQTRALMRLKASLDSVRMGSPVTPAEKTSIKKGLMGVVMVPKVPTLTALETLSGHLANGLANRTSANAQTGPMALTLRGALNSTDLANLDLTEILNEHRSALKASRVRPSDVTPIMESLKTVSNQVRSRR
jgi:exonuclease VII large subunit